MSVSPFVRKAFDLVSDHKTDDIISWTKDGRSFVIKKPHVLQKKILPQYFKHNNLCSFVRQLNTYGFRKIIAPTTCKDTSSRPSRRRHSKKDDDEEYEEDEDEEDEYNNDDDDGEDEEEEDNGGNNGARAEDEGDDSGGKGNGEGGIDDPNDIMEFRHPHFVRGNVESLPLVTRHRPQRRKGGRSSSASSRSGDQNSSDASDHSGSSLESEVIQLRQETKMLSKALIALSRQNQAAAESLHAMSVEIEELKKRLYSDAFGQHPHHLSSSSSSSVPNSSCFGLSSHSPSSSSSALSPVSSMASVSPNMSGPPPAKRRFFDADGAEETDSLLSLTCEDGQSDHHLDYPFKKEDTFCEGGDYEWMDLFPMSYQR